VRLDHRRIIGAVPEKRVKMALIPVKARKTVADFLAEARARLRRLQPEEAYRACKSDRVLVDIRGAEQVAAQGTIPGALWIPRNVLEWRVDPSSGHQQPELAGRENDVVLICAEGFQSSLAAAALHELGLTGVTDVAGGFDAWRAAGLPVESA
jgi:rhodanese-related sulfurtransferase